MTGIIPDARRAEGLGYWGLASTLAIAAAPSAGLWLLQRGWGWLCFCMGGLAAGMFCIALRFPEKRVHRSGGLEGLFSTSLIEQRVFLLALTLFLYTFGYGGITSFVALYTRDSGVRPEGLFFSIFSVVIIATRPFLGRLADKKGRTRVMTSSFSGPQRFSKHRQQMSDYPSRSQATSGPYMSAAPSRSVKSGSNLPCT